MVRSLLAFITLTLILAGNTPAGEDAPYRRQEDVIYGRKYGTALTLDVFTPTGKANGAAVVHVISGGWFSAHEVVNPAAAAEFTRRGYTVFAVVHGSQPKYTIDEILPDLHRAVRHIRHNAQTYKIDPERIGITGGSAGGHLSLMMGVTGKEGDARAKDAIEQASSRIQAVACFFPPTDFLNYGEPGRLILPAMPERIKPAFAFHERDKETGGFVRITDDAKLRQLYRELSPITHVTSRSAPALILHGDKDVLVPMQQAEVMVARLKETGVPAELVVKPGAAHGWKDMGQDLGRFADWFDRYLLKEAGR